MGSACGRSAGDQRDHLRHSEWVCNGRTLPKAMTRTRRSTIASCVGARWAYQPHFCGTGWQSRKPDQLMIGATQLKAHLTAASLLERGCSPPYRSHQGRLEFKTPCRVRQHGKPVALLLSEGQMSDYKGDALLLPALPKAKELLGDRSYDADWFRAALREKGITPCIPPRKNRKTQIEYDRQLYKQRHKVENMFGRLKDWRASPCVMTVAPTPSSPPSVSPLPSSSISINES